MAPARNNTGNTTFVDATVTPGNSYLYRVAAVNGASGHRTRTRPSRPPSSCRLSRPPPGLAAGAVKANGNNYTATLTWADNSTNPTSFTIQRATNAAFTTGLTNSTVAGNARTVHQTVTKNTTYYFRIQANDAISGSSAWVNALPFPIRTGP